MVPERLDTMYSIYVQLYLICVYIVHIDIYVYMFSIMNTFVYAESDIRK